MAYNAKGTRIFVGALASYVTNAPYFSLKGINTYLHEVIGCPYRLSHIRNIRMRSDALIVEARPNTTPSGLECDVMAHLV